MRNFFPLRGSGTGFRRGFLCDYAGRCRRPLHSHCFLCVGNGQCPFRNSQQPCGGGKILRIRAPCGGGKPPPYFIITDISPIRGITPPYRIKLSLQTPICARRVLHKIYRVADAPCKGRYGQFTVRRQSEMHYGFIGDFADCAILS